MTKHTDKKDDTLVQMTLLGDESAFEELVLRHERAVKGTAYKITGNTYSAEDASQDAFVSAWMSLSALREPDKFGAWVCAIAKNHARQLMVHYRSTVPDISLEDIENVAVDDWRADMAREADAAELHGAVDALSEKIREAISLHYFEGLSVRAIADRLGVPEGTVKWRLSEGRKQLRKGYGMMEETYNENEALVTRVMREVTALKLWMIRDDKSGFEAEYRRVLAMVEELPESVEKNFMLADTLKMGVWWVPGAENDEMIEHIREVAFKGHNEEVMQYVACLDYDKFSGQEKIDYMANTQIPYYREHEFVKTTAYLTFWLGHYRVDMGDHEGAIKAFREVTEQLTPADVYYANAQAALAVEYDTMDIEDREGRLSFAATGEVYKWIDGRLCFWEQPGFSRGGNQAVSLGSIFWNAKQYESAIYDPTMQVGETRMTSGGERSICYREAGASCETQAGRFEGCSVYVYKNGDSDAVSYCETWFAPGVGVVRQMVTRRGETAEWVLSAYTIKGGEGLLPLAADNSWSYVPAGEHPYIQEVTNNFTVTSYEDGTAVVSNNMVARVLAYKDSWEGKMLEARQEYYRDLPDGREELVDVRHLHAKAAVMAETKRQKKHTEVASRVMNRIFETDETANPAYTEKGKWNFFEYVTVNAGDRRVMLTDDREHSFEWKDTPLGGESGFRVLHSFFDEILYGSLGAIWSDEWVDGYAVDEQRYNGRTVKCFTVTGGETVTTPAGTFEDCRHIRFVMEFDRPGYNYMTGRSDYWFAPGVGIVKYTHPLSDEEDVLWQLTDFRGVGEGYFPVADDLWRHYEPADLSEGWHAYMEYTYVVDEEGALILRDAKGTQDKADHEVAVKS